MKMKREKGSEKRKRNGRYNKVIANGIIETQMEYEMMKDVTQ